MEEYEQEGIALSEQLDFEDNVYIVTVLESSQRPSGIFSQIEWLGMTSALSLSKRAEGGPLLRRIEQIRLPDIQLDQIVQTTAGTGGLPGIAGATHSASSPKARVHDDDHHHNQYQQQQQQFQHNHYQQHHNGGGGSGGGGGGGGGGGSGGLPRASFTIHHRAGSVVYGTSDFVVQNRSLLFFNPSMRNMVDAAKASRDSFVVRS
jgi:hypothetical protein